MSSTPPRLLRRRNLSATVAAAAVGALGWAAVGASPIDARETGDSAAVPFRYAVSAKKHGAKGTRLTRLVVRGLPAGATFNITCSPAGTGCSPSGTIPVKSSTADDGSQTIRVATKGLGAFPVKATISLSASATGATPHVVQLKVTKPGKVAEIFETP